MMTKFKLLFVLVLFAACNSIQDKANNESFTANEKVVWIGDERELPFSDSLFYLNYPAPLFRKEFNAKDVIESAKLYITAAGYYKATVNGKPVGENVLAPDWTDFSKRIYLLF